MAINIKKEGAKIGEEGGGKGASAHISRKVDAVGRVSGVFRLGRENSLRFKKSVGTT